MTYTHRLATLEDVGAIAPLMSAFAAERSTVDFSLTIKPNYDFSQYITYQLQKSNCFCFVLEHQKSQTSSEIVGFFFFFAYDEAPPPQLPENLRHQYEQESPFLPRRVASALGLYVQPQHRNAQGIQQLILAGMEYVEHWKVSDVDVLISAEQTGIQSLLERLGFTKSAVQYTRHYDISPDTELPCLHPAYPDTLDLELPEPSAIPLRDPDTNELVRNLQGEPVFLSPLRDEVGQLIMGSNNSPIYPVPLREPQNNQWVFDTTGQLVVSPVLLDEQGQVFECKGIPQFYPPFYQFVDSYLCLKKDEDGYYLFCDVERDARGNIVRTPEGLPVFKSGLSVR